MNTTGRDFVDFWMYVVEKGLMNENTAMSLAAPVKQILSVDNDWENQNIIELNVDDLIHRFRNIRSREYRPDTLSAYERRFRQAYKLFLDYIQNPGAWKFQSQNKPNRKPKSERSDKQQKKNREIPKEENENNQIGNNISLVEYPYPLRESCIVRLRLPQDLTVTEVERLTAFMRTLTRDFSPTQA